MPTTKRKRDWFDYLGPVLSSILAAVVLLAVSKGCANSQSTKDSVNALTGSVTHLTDSTIPLLQKDVTQIQHDVTANKSDLEVKNQGLQSQIKGIYEQQNTLKDKINDLQIQSAKHIPPTEHTPQD